MHSNTIKHTIMDARWIYRGMLLKSAVSTRNNIGRRGLVVDEESFTTILRRLHMPGYLKALLYIAYKSKKTENGVVQLPLVLRRSKYPFNRNDIYRLEYEGMIAMVKEENRIVVSMLAKGWEELKALREILEVVS
ncbi:hypothetical protein [Alphaspiravirus yamagawaense]|uniref:Uncharacterized protein n=1 Tax=Alphaspiravirus yamagawaense TaxID=1157339 RepID=J7Q215_9VIRU|nr:hypothetical protein [Aeropyrum coil-shaped virus]CCG27865.1 hypothetical protein [Aeropyrum coil-shaped virus]